MTPPIPPYPNSSYITGVTFDKFRCHRGDGCPSGGGGWFGPAFAWVRYDAGADRRCISGTGGHLATAPGGAGRLNAMPLCGSAMNPQPRSSLHLGGVNAAAWIRLMIAAQQRRGSP